MTDDMSATNDTVCDESSSTRTAFISVGTAVGTCGCIFNTLLLYIFIKKTRRTYPFQTFLAFLDLVLCVLYIYGFGLLSLAVEWKIPFLYNLVMDTNVTTMVIGRIVQITIPYTLIANSADKLALIYGINMESKHFFHFRLVVIVILLVTGILLRANGFILLSVSFGENCDVYQSKWMSQRQLPEKEAEKWNKFENILTFFHTFVSFLVLLALNIIVVLKLRCEHRKARRQSTSPSQLFSSSIQRSEIAREIQEQQHRLRCAVKTTAVIITVYLSCNCLNFVLYSMETFKRDLIMTDLGTFEPFYVILSDVASVTFVLSSTIRIFVYYKYNSDIRYHIKQLSFVKYLTSTEENKIDELLKVDL